MIYLYNSFASLVFGCASRFILSELFLSNFLVCFPHSKYVVHSTTNGFSIFYVIFLSGISISFRFSFFLFFLVLSANMGRSCRHLPRAKMQFTTRPKLMFEANPMKLTIFHAINEIWDIELYENGRSNWDSTWIMHAIQISCFGNRYSVFENS